MKTCDWLINNQCSPEAQAIGGFAGYSFPSAGYFYDSKHKKKLSVTFILNFSEGPKRNENHNLW